MYETRCRKRYIILFVISWCLSKSPIVYGSFWNKDTVNDNLLYFPFLKINIINFSNVTLLFMPNATQIVVYCCIMTIDICMTIMREYFARDIVNRWGSTELIHNNLFFKVFNPITFWYWWWVEFLKATY